MSNILITPAAANKAEELREGIGSGPFTVAPRIRAPARTSWCATRTTGARRPLLAEVNVVYQEDEGARVIAITSGQTDVIDTITPESAASLKTKPGHRGHPDDGHPLDPPLLQLPQTPRTR